LTERPHRRRTWTVQSYSPANANVHPHPIHASLDRLTRVHDPNGILDRFSGFWATVCKTVRPMLSHRCLSVCNCGQTVGRIKMTTLHAGRPRPWPHCVRWGPSSPSPKGAEPHPQFFAHICCCQMAAGIKMPLGMEVGLGPGDFVLDGDPAPLTQKGAELPIFGPCLLWPNGWMDQDDSWHGGRPQPRRLYVRWGPTPLPKRGRAPFPDFRPVSIVAKRLDVSRCHLVWR